jgi:hydroxymethylglutaryl-CoA reductase
MAKSKEENGGLVSMKKRDNTELIISYLLASVIGGLVGSGAFLLNEVPINLVSLFGYNFMASFISIGIFIYLNQKVK